MLPAGFVDCLYQTPMEMGFFFLCQFWAKTYIMDLNEVKCVKQKTIIKLDKIFNNSVIIYLRIGSGHDIYTYIYAVWGQ